MPATPILLLMAARGETGVEPLPPELATVFAFEQEPISCDSPDGWTNRVSWTVTNPNNALFKIEVRYTPVPDSTDFTTVLASDLPCASGTFDHRTGFQGNPESEDEGTHYARYQVRILRRSDNNSIDSGMSAQLLVNYGHCD